MAWNRRIGWSWAAAVLLLSSCREAPRAVVAAAPVGMVDRTFHSPALGRDETYRVRPGRSGAGPARVNYLLHGNGGTYAEWSRDSAIVRLAPADWTLVMPEGGSSYWMNSASVAQDRYEDFVTRDLVAEAERKLGGPVDRAIVGNSMGGFAALVLGMKHPGLYGFVGALSPPVDYPERAFSLKRVGQSMAIRAIFGPEGSATRKANDPFALAAHADSARLPYIFLSVGDQEPLLGPVKRFEALLDARHIKHEFHVEPGGHNWDNWNQVLPMLVGSSEKQAQERGSKG